MRRRDRYDNGYDQGYDSRYDDRGGRGRRGGCGCGCGLAAFIVLLLLAGLVAAAEFGGRWYLTDRIEREASSRLGASVAAELGTTPLLWTLATDRSVESIRLTSPGAATVPRIDVTARGVRLDGGTIGGSGTVRADSADGTATVTEPQLTEAATSGGSGDGDMVTGPIGDSIRVESVRPDAAAGMLRADIGGVAEIGLVPGAEGGRLTLTPQETSILGIPLPDGLFSGITTTVESAVEALPEGMAIDGARVVEDGLEVQLSGADVSLR